MGFKDSQKLAILLCQFSDNDSEPFDEAYFQDLFVNRNTEGLNDYYITASLGAVNFDGSQVFPWKSCNKDQAALIAESPARSQKIDVACQTHGVSRSDYFAVVAVYNDNTNDAGASGNGVLTWTTAGEIQVTLLAHELGHCFGLNDSFDESDRRVSKDATPGWYWDQYDIMSARNVFDHVHPRWGRTGPLMCAANQDYNGWIPADRIWSPQPGSNTTETIDLVSLGHYSDVPGYLCVKWDGWYMEFRTDDGLDAGLAHPCVLVHSMTPTVNATLHNYSHVGATWDNEWLPGRIVGPSDGNVTVFGGTQIEVLSFDTSTYKARIRIRHVTARPPIRAGPGQIFGGVSVDGGGVIILPGGQVIKIPPRSPVMGMLGHVALVAQSEERLIGQARQVVTSQIYKEIEGMASRASKREASETVETKRC